MRSSRKEPWQESRASKNQRCQPRWILPRSGSHCAFERDAPDRRAPQLDYSKRSGPDDFSSLTGFLEIYPNCPWNVALLTNLGLEYYNTGHYSKTLEVWGQAWELGRAATDLKGKAIVDRAVGELACMHARLGQMTE